MSKITNWANYRRIRPMFELICLYGSVFVYCFAIGIYAAIIPNFIQQKVCSPDAEPDLNSPCSDNRKVLEATDIITTRGVVREGVPVFILLLAGLWRDSTGLNKPLMYSALIGEVIGVSIQLFVTWKWTISIWTASIAESVFYGVFGGSKLFYVAATCAITDQSNVDQRTIRIMFYQAASYAGSCISSALSGYTLNLLGYIWFFLMVLVLHLFTILLVILSKESERRLNSGEKVEIFKNIKSITKSRPNNLVIWLMLVSCVTINVCASAESNLYLYYLQLTFDFTVKEAGLYTGFRQMFAVISTMILSPVLTKVLKWSDFRIGILSSFTTMIAATLMVFAKTITQLIIFGILDFLKIFVHSMPMSIVTKCVKSDEVGIFVSLRFIAGCLLPMIIFYIYDVIFSATSNLLPSSFFIASAIITLLVFMCFWVCSCIYSEPNEVLENNSTVNTDTEKRKNDGISENTESIGMR